METNDAQVERISIWVIGLISLLALALVAYVLLMHQEIRGGINLRFLPAVNAGFNTLSFVCLIAGYRAIRRSKPAIHQRWMLRAFIASLCFLVGYLAYHFVHGDTRYPGDGADRILYLGILVTHIILSMALVPLVLMSFWLALSGRFERHRKVAKVTFPIWLYVSLSGVIVYVMLHLSLATTQGNHG